MSVSYRTFQDIFDDVLFRSSEIDTGSEYQEQAKRYILRAYGAVLYGDADLLPRAVIPSWRWLRQEGTIALNGSTNNTGKYPLPDDFDSLDGLVYTPYNNPIVVQGFNQVMDQRMWRTQRRQLNEIPQVCAITADPDVTNNFRYSIIFDANGPPNEVVNLTYTYEQLQDINTWSPGAQPRIPEQYRKILADYALYFIMFDKDDDRATTVGLLVQNTLTQMVRLESRRSVPTDSPLMGQLTVDIVSQTRVKISLDGYRGAYLGRR